VIHPVNTKQQKENWAIYSPTILFFSLTKRKLSDFGFCVCVCVCVCVWESVVLYGRSKKQVWVGLQSFTKSQFIGWKKCFEKSELKPILNLQCCGEYRPIKTEHHGIIEDRMHRCCGEYRPIVIFSEKSRISFSQCLSLYFKNIFKKV